MQTPSWKLLKFIFILCLVDILVKCGLIPYSTHCHLIYTNNIILIHDCTVCQYSSYSSSTQCIVYLTGQPFCSSVCVFVIFYNDND